MEEKKSAKANLENDRSTFLLLGFVVALSTLFVAFEWESRESLSPDWAGFSSLFIENESAGVRETQVEAEQPKTKEVTVAQPVVLSDEFNAVEKVIEDTLPVLEEKKELNEVSSTVQETLENSVYTQADKMPQFKGGYTELVRFLYKNTKYPSVALKQRIQGKVWCSFVIEKDGSVSDIHLEQSVYAFLDDEALRVLQIMPAWEPGTIAGQPVRVKVYLPIVFKL